MAAASSVLSRTPALPLRLVAELMQFETEDGQRLADYLHVLQHSDLFAEPLAELQRQQLRYCHPRLTSLAKEIEVVEEQLSRVLTEPELVEACADSDVLAPLCSWTLTMRLCESCVEITAREPRRGLAISRAARALAQRVGSIYLDDERWQLEALTWAHEANAHRVPGDLEAAEYCFARLAGLVPEAGYELPGIWAEICWIEGSLLRDRREFDAARRSLSRSALLAQQSGREGVHAGALLNMASLDCEAGDYKAAVAKTELVLELLDPERYPRWYAQAAGNLASYLNLGGKPDIALQQLSRYRDAIRIHGSTADRLRTVWSEAATLRSLGRCAEAIASYDQARRGFLRMERGYDAALLALELADIHLEQGHTMEVHRLASEILPVFEGAGIDREASVTRELLRRAALPNS